MTVTLVIRNAAIAAHLHVQLA